VRRAVRIGKAVRPESNDAATFADVLDSLSAGLVPDRCQAFSSHANAAAEAFSVLTIFCARSAAG